MMLSISSVKNSSQISPAVVASAELGESEGPRYLNLHCKYENRYYTGIGVEALIFLQKSC